MSKNEVVQEEEISFFDLGRKLQRGWRYVVAGMLLGLMGAVLAIATIPPKYEAIAILQVAQVANQPVEPAVQAFERIKTPSFQLSVANELGDQAWIDGLLTSPIATTRYISLQLVKSAPNQGATALIELKANSDSAEKAKKIADTFVRELAKRHTELAKPFTDKIRLDLTIAREKLASAEKELQSINKLTANAGVKDDRFTQLSLMTSLRVQKEAELFSQRQMIMALETSLLAPATQPSKAIEEAFVTNKPVSPKKGSLFALGLLGGLLAGIVSVFLGDAWRRAKREHAESATS